jgi:hypothetical protein
MLARRLLHVGFLLIVLGLRFSARVERAAPAARAHVPAGAIALPVMFEPDATGTAFLARARGYTMQVSARGGTVQLGREGNARRVDLTFVRGGGELTPGRRLPTTVSYLQGPREQWRTGVPAYRDVRVRDVYRGVDAVFYGVDREIEYDLVVAPGADVTQIALRVDGADRVFLEGGKLRIAAGDHVLIQRPPVAYQTINGRRARVESRYELADNGEVRFSVGDYDRASTLVIDPTITYSTYFGGTGPDTISDVATDDIGNVYVVGGSTSADLPIAGSGWKTERHAYIAKLRPDGTPEWLTYLAGSGGNGSDHAVAVDVGPGGDAYVTGVGCGDGFPTTPGAYRTAGVPQTCDAFVARFAPDSTLKYSTLLGAPSPWGPVGAAAIVVDPIGRAAIAGATASPDFVPTMTASYGPTRPGLDQPDGFVAMLSADGSRLDWSRLLAGSGYDYVTAMARDQWGNLWVAGHTTSGDYPIQTTIKPQKHGPTDPYGEVGYDGFLTQLWEDGQQGMSTFLGGSGEDFMNAVAVGLYDRVYVGGQTNSPEAATYNHDPSKDNGVIYHIGSRSLLKTGLVGGTGYTAVTALAVGPESMLWVAGQTDGAGFFLNAPDDRLPQPGVAGGHDMFLQMYEPDLSGLWYSYVIGGTGNENATGLAIDRLGDIYLVGGTASTDYPVKRPLQASKKDALSRDGVITKLACYVKAFLPVDTQPAAGGDGFVYVYDAPGCLIEAVSDSAWLRITGRSGQQLTFITDPNPTSAERHASITLSGKKVAPVIQAAGAGGGVPATDEIVLDASDIDGAFGDWSVVADDVHGSILTQPDRGAPKVETAATHPSNWFSFTFTAEAGKPYHLWVHGRAQGDSWRNDSIYAQFSDSVDASGNPIYRIGTTSATWVSLEECSGCGVQGWGWQDNQYGARGDLGPDIYFATSGTHTIKFQTREDGFDIGQVVLSARAYLRTAPGGNMNDPTIVTLGTAPPPEPQPIDEIVLWAANDAQVISGGWRVIGDSTAAGQTTIWNPDSGTPKLASPHATPGSYFDINFNAEAGKPYHLWLRMKADADHWANDSVWVQFSGSVDASGSPVYRIGSGSGTWVSLEECSGCGEQGWGWQDNAYGSAGDLGPPIYFGASGAQTIRIQNREDGVRIDQIVLSAGRYATSAPGSNKNDTTILPRTPK